MNLRTLLGMPSSNLPPRLVTPHRGTDVHDPKQALTPAELAQVRADLALVEPHACTYRLVFRRDKVITHIDDECGKPATVEVLFACGHSTYACPEHEPKNWTGAFMYCRNCNAQTSRDEHLVAVLPC